jgi:hypothetical protein
VASTDCVLKGLTSALPTQEKSLWELDHQLCWDLHFSLLQCEKSRGDTKAAGKLIQALGRKTKTTQQTVRKPFPFHFPLVSPEHQMPYKRLRLSGSAFFHASGRIGPGSAPFFSSLLYS